MVHVGGVLPDGQQTPGARQYTDHGQGQHAHHRVAHAPAGSGVGYLGQDIEQTLARQDLDGAGWHSGVASPSRNAGLFKHYPSSPKQATPQPPHPQNPPSPQASPTTNNFAEPLDPDKPP